MLTLAGFHLTDGGDALYRQRSWEMDGHGAIPFRNGAMNYHSPWIAVSSADWSRLLKDRPTVRFKKNETIYRVGEYSDHAYILLSGRVRLFITSKEGNELTLAIVRKGSLIGELFLFDTEPNLVNAVALDDTEVASIDRATFLDKVFSDKELNRQIIHHFSEKVRVLFSYIESLHFRSAESRLGLTLIALIKEYGDPEGRINLKFTHQELANITCMSRVSVSNILNHFYQEGILAKDHGYIILKDMGKLEAIIDE